MGTAASEQRQQLEVTYPISNGIVQNWEDMGHIWDHTFYNVLKVSNGICLAIMYLHSTFKNLSANSDILHFSGTFWWELIPYDGQLVVLHTIIIFLATCRACLVVFELV